MARRSVIYGTVLLITLDVAAVVLATILAYVLRFESGWLAFEEYHPFRNYYGYLATLALAEPIVLAANGLYRPYRTVSWVDYSYTILTGTSVATAIAILVSAIMWRDVSSSRLLVALSWVLSIVFAALGRYAFFSVVSTMRRRGLGAQRLLIVGSGDTANLVLGRVRRSPETGYRPVGFVTESASVTALDGLPILGSLDNIGTVVAKHRIDDVIIAMPTLSQQRLVEVVTQCASQSVNIKVFPDLFQFMTSDVSIGDLNGLPLISVKDVALRGWNVTLKRAMDIAVSATLLVLLSPLMLLIALLIKTTSPDGPVFLVQERVGLDGRPFPIIKFRSMKPDAEKTTGAIWATPDDPRRTRLGAFLRRYSLDELPQFINVLVGDMSVVGPRPERPVFVEMFRRTIPRYFDRHREKAGITGWAQVNGLRGNTSIEERTAYDLWYVENWSFWLDVKICLRTLFVVFKDRNAY
jgi:Undecaprenyl-phosphate glucose phosphotransferase